MRPRKKSKSRRAAATVATVATVAIVVMRLYVADGAPNSIKAIANIEAICKEHLPDGYKLEIIDVLEFPQRALADGIVVTPSLTKISPSPAARIVGNLSDRSSVLYALGLRA